MEMVKKYYLKFMMYAIIGWCYEVFLEVFILNTISTPQNTNYEQ